MANDKDGVIKVALGGALFVRGCVAYAIGFNL